MRRYLKYIGPLLLLLSFSACDTSCSDKLVSIELGANKTNSSKMDLSYRLPGKTTETYRNRTILWSYSAGTTFGDYLVCVWNKDSSGFVTASISTKYHKLCTTTTTEIDEYTGEETEETSTSESFYTKSVSDSDGGSVCVSMRVKK